MDYEVKISQFEGPLDLLLHLISKAEIAIEDIFVSDVTDQYLRYISSMEEADMDNMSEFLNIASVLVFIKSRSLLPASKVIEEDENDPELELIEKLRLYKAYKDASVQLRSLEAEADQIFFKLPEEIPELVSDTQLEDSEVSVLYDAYLRLIAKRKKNRDLFKTVSVRHDEYSVKNQSDKIIGLLKTSRAITFSSIFAEQHEPMEIAVTFLALLQLWHDKQINVAQSGQFSEIIITREQ